MHFADITALESLAENIRRLRERDIETCFIYLRRTLRNALSNMTEFSDITILHNLNELRQFTAPGGSHMLDLAGSQPEKLGKKK